MRLWSVSAIAALVLALASVTAAAAPAPTVRARASYTLDACCAVATLAGEPVAVAENRELHDRWQPKLSPRSIGTLAAIEKGVGGGTGTLSGLLTLMVSSTPGWDTTPLTQIFGQPGPMLRAYYEQFPASAAVLPQAVAAQLCVGLAGVFSELEAAGFRQYWDSQRLPLIEASAGKWDGYVAHLPFDPLAEVARVLGPDVPDRTSSVDLYLCSFAAPNGIRLAGRAFVTDSRYDQSLVLRNCIHELFHQPGHPERFGTGVNRLIADPLYESARKVRDALRIGYPTDWSFMEENIVEALEVYTSWRLGVLADPMATLRAHDGGSHMISFVLVDYFNRMHKADDETLAAYLDRVVAAMPVGELSAAYATVEGSHLTLLK